MATLNHDVKRNLMHPNSQEIMAKWYDDVIENYLQKESLSKHPKLSNTGTFTVFKNALQTVYGRKSVLFSLDIEAWERNNNQVTEIGISIYDPSFQLHSMVPTIEAYHIRPKETFHRINGRFVPNHAANFIGEKTLVMSFPDIIKFVSALIRKYFLNTPKPACLIGHNVKGDIKWLRGLGIEFPKAVNIIDTEWVIKLSRQSHTSLHNTLVSLDIPHSFLHNAGNDAYYTLLLAMKILDPFMRDLYGLDTYELKEELALKFKKRDNMTLNICAQEEITLAELQTRHQLDPE